MLVPILLKSYGIVGAIFAEYLGSVSAAASENPSLLFIGIERSIRDADGTKVLIAFYERSLD